MTITGKAVRLATLLFFCLVTLAGSPAVAKETPAWMPSTLRDLPEATTQVLLVSADRPGDFKATMYVLEKRDGAWHEAFPPLPALIGSKGFAPPGEKREGDRRTPSGVFPIKLAFGYGERIDSRMPYRQAGEEDIWVDDAASPDYNRWVRRDETSATSFEVMKRQDDRYKYGIVIEYNTDPVVEGAGSAIFIHVRGGKNLPTLGCVALSEEDILKILARLDPAKQPLAVLGIGAGYP